VVTQQQEDQNNLRPGNKFFKEKGKKRLAPKDAVPRLKRNAKGGGGGTKRMKRGKVKIPSSKGVKFENSF